MEWMDELGIKARQIVKTVKSDVKFIIIDKYHGEDDYSIWWGDDMEDENDGCSLRGTWDDIIEDIAENYRRISKQTRKDVDIALKEIRFA